MRALGAAVTLACLLFAHAVMAESEPHTPRVLFVVSAASEIALQGGDTMDVGYWVVELEHPYRALTEAGYHVDIATPGGKVPTPDPYSASARGLGSEARAQATAAWLKKLPGLRHPQVLEKVDASGYDAIYVPGGYAPMVDLRSSGALGRILREAMADERIVASICHGPAAFLSAEQEGQPWVFEGYEIAAFTNAEERAWLKERKLEWRVEDALKEAGARHTHTGTWGSHVVRDRNVITGQNAPSVRAFTQTLLEALAEKKK